MHRRLRLAFVGQATFFETCLLAAPRARCDPRFHEFRRDADADALLARARRASTPDAVVRLPPRADPAGAFARPRRADARLPDRAAAARGRGARRTRTSSAGCGSSRRSTAANFDRIVAFDPLIAPTADRGSLHVWRSIPLPVADRYFRAVGAPLRGQPAAAVRRALDAAPRALADGRQAPARPAAPRVRRRRRRARAGAGRARRRRSTSTTSTTRASRTASACTSPPAISSSASGCRPRTASSRASTTSRSPAPARCTHALETLAPLPGPLAPRARARAPQGRAVPRLARLAAAAARRDRRRRRVRQRRP